MDKSVVLAVCFVCFLVGVFTGVIGKDNPVVEVRHNDRVYICQQPGVDIYDDFGVLSKFSCDYR